MRKKLGFLIFLIGTSVVAWNGYTWWDQGQSVTHQAQEIKQAHPSWNEQQPLKTVQSVSSETHAVNEHATGEAVGSLDIPKLGKGYPVFWGSDEDTLTKGVGMYDSQWTVTPNQNGHVVLSGHRDTVFRNLDTLEPGDHLYVTYNNISYDYQIRETWITDQHDRSVIVSKMKPTLTLTTCYPFNYIGSAPDRYIIQADLVAADPASEI
ncbi:class D sortase [Mesobacillus harenae]|uniref:class D sortase n=1 Tax=Mesobacillus harenae TaxID=2213203 RepID=UPI00157FE58C|nr:class D sortase [Mesobacillus harenae]